MPVNLTLPISGLLAGAFGFLLVLSRVAGVVLFVPIPGIPSVGGAARLALALGLTLVLLPKWPVLAAGTGLLNRAPVALAAEFVFGLLAGVALSFLLAGFQLAAQMIGLQAGYSFAATFDPATQAESTVLQTVTQLFAGLLFFALGLDRQILRVLAESFDRVPNASALASMPPANAIIRLGSQMLIDGVGLALPVVAVLLLIDLSFAVLGNVHAQFQLLSLSFPVKMMAALVLLAVSFAGMPALLQSGAARTFRLMGGLLGQ